MDAVFYGQLPFVFAYVTGGCRIQFCLLMPNGQPQRLTNCIFDAKLPSHRLAIFRTIVNILRCLRSFEPLFPTETVKLYDEIKRPNGVKVGQKYITGDIHVIISSLGHQDRKSVV